VRVRTSGKLPWWFGIPFALGGVVFAILGVTMVRDELRFGSEGVSVAGTVTDKDYSPGSGDSGPSYTIRYEFTDPATGTPYYGATDVSEEAWDAAAIGRPIEVTYLPAQPTTSRIGSTDPQLLIPLVVVGAGALFAVIGLGVLVVTWRIRKHGVPSWIQVENESSGTSDASQADAMREIFGRLGVASVAAATPAGPSTGSAPVGASAEPAGPLTEDELRALDARLAPPTDTA
jgi:hypothetical protein